MRLKIYGGVTVNGWISFHTFFVWKAIQNHVFLHISQLTLRSWLQTESPSAPIHGATISSATLATATSYLLDCTHGAAFLAAPYRHSWLPKGKYQLLSPVAPCAALRFHFWDISGMVKNASVTVVTTSPFPAPFPVTCSVSHSPAVFWWGSYLRRLRQQLFQQQVITTTHSGHRFLAEGLLMSAEDICHGRDIRDSQVCPSCSSPQQRLTCLLILACITRNSWFNPVERGKCS